FLFAHKAAARPPGDDEAAIQMRLMLQSLMEDGEFARLHLQRVACGWVPKIKECRKAAVAVGDALERPVLAGPGAWFAQHLAGILMTPPRPATPLGYLKVCRATR